MNILFLAYYFPPDSSSGSFRPLFFANNLAELGVGIRVITARPEDYLTEQNTDLRLLDRVARTVKVTRCRVRRPREALIALRNRFVSRAAGGISQQVTSQGIRGRWQKIKDECTDLMATPDQHIGWLPYCVSKGRAMIAEQYPDVILATGGPWSGLLAGAMLKKLSGVPLILDFRDPWASNPSLKFKSRLCRTLHSCLERLAVSVADGIVANTGSLREDFLKKYPFLGEKSIVTITNGFESYHPQTGGERNRRLRILHTGELYLSRDPVPLLAALRNMIDRMEIAPEELMLDFVGTTTGDSRVLAALLEHDGLQRAVRFTPRKSYDEIRDIIAEADVLLVIQPGLPLQIPRKIYDYMAARKPLLCIAEAEGATARIVAEHNLGYICENSPPAIEETLMSVITAWRGGGLPDVSDGRCSRHSNHELSRKLKGFISVVLAERGASQA